MKDNCLFCKIVNKESPANIVYEDEWTLAFLDLYPNSVGHTLVIPKEHFDDLISTDEFYLDKVNKTKQRVGKLLIEKLNPKGLNFASNNGAEAYQVIFHYHEHIIPKYSKPIGMTYVINKDGSEQKPLNEVLETLRK